MANAELPTIATAARLIASRRLSPVELTRSCLQRIEALDGRLNSFLLVRAEAALAEATAAEGEIASGDYRGPLHGIPIALKDNVMTADLPTTGGALVFDGFVPPYEATLVKNLRDAGAVIIACPYFLDRLHRTGLQRGTICSGCRAPSWDRSYRTLCNRL